MGAVKVKVPGTSANLGPGFDCLGMAVEIHNELSFKETDEGVDISVESRNDEYNASKDEDLVYQSAKYLFNHLNKEINGLKIREKLEIPIARGLGSSAAAILGGLFGANEILNKPFSESELLRMAIDIEGHPDNVVPALKGGFNVVIDQDDSLSYKKIETGNDIEIILVVPDFQLDTEDLRKVLPEKVDFSDAVFNHSRTALLMASLYDNDWGMLSLAMQDRLHQDYRSELIPGFDDVVEAALNEEALGVALSGSGPTILAFSHDNSSSIGEAMVEKFSDHGVASDYLITSPNNEGLEIIV